VIAMYLSIDIGTSRLKAALAAGGSFWVEQRTLRLIKNGPRAEQDPDEWLQGLQQLLPRLLSKAAVSSDAIEAICVSSHSPSLVPVDGAGRPLHPCLTWRDRRAAPQAAELLRITGEFFDPSFFEPKILWFREEKPDVYLRTKAFLQPKDFLTAQLTGEFVIDQAAADFSRPYKIPGWDPSKQPRSAASWEVVGETTPQAAQLGLRPGIPVVCGGIDAYVEALGAGLVEPGEFGDATGTSTCLTYCLEEASAVDGAVPHVIPDRRLCIMPLSSGGGTLAWALEQLGAGLGYDQLEEAVSRVAPGADGLLFLPYLEGERSPVWDNRAQGVFFGLTSRHTRDHLLRAVLEGTAFAVRHNLEYLSDLGLRPAYVRATGGGSRLNVWNQVKADITGLAYEQLEVADGALLGGVLLCALAVEQRAVGELAQEYAHTRRRFAPRSFPVYDELYTKYKKLYECTKEIMR